MDTNPRLTTVGEAKQSTMIHSDTTSDDGVPTYLTADDNDIITDVHNNDGGDLPGDYPDSMHSLAVHLRVLDSLEKIEAIAAADSCDPEEWVHIDTVVERAVNRAIERHCDLSETSVATITDGILYDDIEPLMDIGVLRCGRNPDGHYIRPGPNHDVLLDMIHAAEDALATHL